MKISTTGDNLNIIINTKFSDCNDWMAFAAWNSIYRNLPDAAVSVLCARDLSGGNLVFQWPNRCGVEYFQYQNLESIFKVPLLNKIYATYIALKDGLAKQPLLVIDDDIMAARSFSSEVSNILSNDSIRFAVNHSVWYFNSQSLETFADVLNKLVHDSEDGVSVDTMQIMDELLGRPEIIDDLCGSVKASNDISFVKCSHCCKFDKEEWVAKKYNPPFAFTRQISADGVETANELAILRLWKNMNTLYTSVR